MLWVRRFTRMVKWLSVAAATVLAVAWPVSLWTEAERSMGDNYALSAGSGVFVLVRRTDPAFFSLSELKPGLRCELVEHPREKWEWWFAHYTSVALESYVVPIWCPVSLLGIAAALLWRLDVRIRAKPGSCPFCGYDRRGLNVNAQCPECGKTVQAAGRSSR